MMKRVKLPGRMHASASDKPPTESDRKMAISHSRDSFKYNMRHAKDHMKAAKAAKSRLQKVTKARVRAI